MTISATAVRFDEHTVWVDLSGGRTLGVPLAWFPRLMRATPEQRERVELGRTGLHWEELGITFTSGKAYTYFEVPKSVYERFLAAPSKGQFFNDNIKDEYRFS